MNCKNCGTEIQVWKLPAKHYRAVCPVCNWRTSPYKTEEEALTAYDQGKVADYNSIIDPGVRFR